MKENPVLGMDPRAPAFFPKYASTLRLACQRVAFYVAYLLFGSIGLVTSLGAAAVSVVATSPTARSLGQRMINRLFAFFTWYVRTCGLLDLKVTGLETLRGQRNLILAANHPSLLDAVFVAAHLPNVFCLMKASLVQNMVLCGQAKLAGYVNNKSGVGLVKSCQARMREGSNLLVFPEGTRTRAGCLGQFKMGFALLSRTLDAAVQTVLIEYDHMFLGKDWPFFKPPPFPLHCTITLGRRFHPEDYGDLAAYGRELEAYFQEAVCNMRNSPP